MKTKTKIKSQPTSATNRLISIQYIPARLTFDRNGTSEPLITSAPANVGGVSKRSRNGAPSRKGCVVNARNTSRQATNDYAPPPPPPRGYGCVWGRVLLPCMAVVS